MACTQAPVAPVAVTPLVISGYTPITARIGESITAQTPGIDGAVGALTFSVTPSLPTGLVLNPSTGALSGAADAVAALKNYSVLVLDAKGLSATATVAIQITASSIAFTQAYQAVSAVVSTAITPQTPLIRGAFGAYSYRVSPSLPSGLTINPRTGELSGTPAAAAPFASYEVTVTDASDAVSTVSFALQVTSGLQPLTGYAPISAELNTPITPQTPVLGGSVGSLSFTVTPALPAGLNVDPSSGRISGTPTALSTLQNYQVDVADGYAGTASFGVTIEVKKVGLLRFAAAYQPVLAFTGKAITPQTPTVTGNTESLSYLVAPMLPSGLSLNASSGLISGTPTATAPLTSYTVTVTDQSGSTATTALTLQVAARLAFSQGYSDVTATATGQIRSQVPVVTGGIGTRAFAVTPGLPTGIALNAQTGELSGSTATALSARVSVTVTDAFANTDTVDVLLIVMAAPVILLNPSNPLNLTQNIAVSLTQSSPPRVTDGNAPFTFSITPSLPSGLALNASNGVITGRPLVSAASTVYTLNVRDANNVTSSRTLTIAVNPTLNFGGLSGFKLLVGSATVNQNAVVSGGTAPFTYSSSGSLPVGVTRTGGSLAGTPSAALTLNTYSITVTDANNAQATQSIVVGAYNVSNLAVTATTTGSSNLGSASNGALVLTGTAGVSSGQVRLVASANATTGAGITTALVASAIGSGSIPAGFSCALGGTNAENFVEIVGSSVNGCTLRGLGAASSANGLKLTMISVANPSYRIVLEIVTLGAVVVPI